MADIIDKANDRSEEILEEALQKRKAEGPKITGRCHFCGAPVDNKRFCDAECRDEWEHELKMHSRLYATGKPEPLAEYDMYDDED